ncbi:putative ribosomal protein S14 [Helianthus annuus]|nr:putative ribosomal protein S14 [Helianthus annuus]
MCQMCRKSKKLDRNYTLTNTSGTILVTYFIFPQFIQTLISNIIFNLHLQIFISLISKTSTTMSDKRNIQDQKRRLLAEKFELRRKLYKAFTKDTDLPNDVREKHRCKLAALPRNSSFTRVMNRCVFTGRAHAVYKMFRVSRIVFRDLASRGLLQGVKKASW